jgi:phage terminase large subunit-like protein
LIDIAKEPIPIVAVSPGSKSKEIRMMETVPMFESGRILFNPRLDSSLNHDVSARGDLISQLVNFASATDKDLGDAFAYAVRGVKDFRTHEDDDDWASGDGMVTRLSIIGR